MSTPTPLPLLCEEVDGNCVEVRFESLGKCRRIGPEIFPTGKITIIFSNYTDFNSGLELEMLDEDKTWKDVYDFMGGGGIYSGPQPEWTFDIIGTAGLEPGWFSIKDIELTAGSYISLCRTSAASSIGYRLYLADSELIIED
jgi:hypothetical protein